MVFITYCLNSYGQDNHEAIAFGTHIAGNIGIFNKGVIAINGDLLMDSIEVSGNGKLILVDCKTQTITSKNASINNLEVDNPTKIVLKGKLKIKSRIVINKAVFDCSKAFLQIEESADIILLNEGKILLKNELGMFNPNPISQDNPKLLIDKDFNNCDENTAYFLPPTSQTLTTFLHQNYYYSHKELIDKPPKFYSQLISW